MRDEEIAPNLVIFFERIPQTKGPRKIEPIAPQDIPRIATIVSKFT